jgi:hypothetical protein
MYNAISNPKKEFTINYSIEEAKAAVLKLQKKDCVLQKDDAVLNEIVLHEKETLGFGYDVSFQLEAINETSTKVIIEVSRHNGAINSSAEITIANNKLKRLANEFSSAISGTPLPKAAGCMVVLLAMSSILIASFILVTSLI